MASQVPLMHGLVILRTRFMEFRCVGTQSRA